MIKKNLETKLGNFPIFWKDYQLKIYEKDIHKKNVRL